MFCKILPFFEHSGIYFIICCTGDLIAAGIADPDYHIVTGFQCSRRLCIVLIGKELEFDLRINFCDPFRDIIDEIDHNPGLPFFRSQCGTGFTQTVTAVVIVGYIIDQWSRDPSFPAGFIGSLDVIQNQFCEKFPEFGIGQTKLSCMLSAIPFSIPETEEMRMRLHINLGGKIPVKGVAGIGRSIIKRTAIFLVKRNISAPGHSPGNGIKPPIRMIGFSNIDITELKGKFELFINGGNSDDFGFRNISHDWSEEPHIQHLFDKIECSVQNSTGSAAVDENFFTDFPDHKRIALHSAPEESGFSGKFGIAKMDLFNDIAADNEPSGTFGKIFFQFLFRSAFRQCGIFRNNDLRRLNSGAIHLTASAGKQSRK